jgi:hypothetical protein
MPGIENHQVPIDPILSTRSWRPFSLLIFPSFPGVSRREPGRAFELGAVYRNPRCFSKIAKPALACRHGKRLSSSTGQRSSKDAIKVGPNLYGKPCQITAVTGNRALDVSRRNF